jgi:hypothetical protein
MRRNLSRYTYSPPGAFDSECPDVGEIRQLHWRNDRETRLEDFARIARKRSVKVAQVKDEFKDIFVLSKAKFTGSITTAEYLVLYSIYRCIFFI